MSTHTVDQIKLKLERVSSLLKSQQKYICTVESCTGGMLAMWLTELPGSSSWFDCGVVSYTNQSKTALLGVEPYLIDQNGAVSESVALAMALGGLALSQADIAVSITGIAGPSGGTIEKPVGTVCFGVAAKHQSVVLTKHFENQNRHSIRSQSCLTALHMVEQFID